MRSMLLMDVIGANDFPGLLARTAELECPIQWKHEGDFADVLRSFGLTEITGYGPDQLTAEALARYQAQLDALNETLADLGLTDLRLLTNNPRKIIGLEGFGLTISERVPIEVPADPANVDYLRTKRDKLGHLLKGI